MKTVLKHWVHWVMFAAAGFAGCNKAQAPNATMPPPEVEVSTDSSR